MLKRLLIIFGVLLIVGTSIFLVHRSRAAKVDDSADTSIAVASYGPILESVSATGKVTSFHDVDIKCQASGKVIKLPFDISQSVKTGDLLLQLDPVDQHRIVQQAEANVGISQAKLNEAKQNLIVGEQTIVTARDQADAAVKSDEVRAANLRKKADRQAKLLTQNLASPEDAESAETDAAQAEADLETAKVQVEVVKTQEVALETKRQEVELSQRQLDLDNVVLDAARQQEAYCTVVSPMDGVVSALNVQIGTIISSGITNIGGGTTICTLSDLSRIFLLASVDESDIGGITVGLPVKVTADSFPGRTFTAKVVRIATKGVNVSNVVTFEVQVEVTGDDKSLLKPEMTGNVEIILKDHESTLLVPAAALSKGPDGQFTATVVKGDNSREDRKVTVGITDGDNTEILGGLTNGEKVVVQNEVQSRWSGDQSAQGSTATSRKSGS